MKKLSILLIAAILLCGCNFGTPADSENISGTSPAPETTTAASSETTRAEAASVTEETKPAEETDSSVEDDQESLEEFILEAAQHENKYGSNSEYTVIPLIYEDLDSDGKNELIAVYGRTYELSDEKNHTSGDLWFANEKKAVKLNYKTLYDIFLDEAENNINDFIEIKNIDGHSIAFVKEKSVGYAGDDYHYTYLYDISGGSIKELDISGKFGRFTDLGKKAGLENFSAIKFDRDITQFYTGGTTWKNYWFYFENGEFKEYTGEKITKADL